MIYHKQWVFTTSHHEGASRDEDHGAGRGEGRGGDRGGDRGGGRGEDRGGANRGASRGVTDRDRDAGRDDREQRASSQLELAPPLFPRGGDGCYERGKGLR